jgi:hypothetical protein
MAYKNRTHRMLFGLYIMDKPEWVEILKICGWILRLSKRRRDQYHPVGSVAGRRRRNHDWFDVTERGACRRGGPVFHRRRPVYKNYARDDMILTRFFSQQRIVSVRPSDGYRTDRFRESVAKKRVIGISLCVAAIERCPVRFVIGRTAVQALRQIRIGKIRRTERYHVR